jgi:ATP-dependent Zn protease
MASILGNRTDPVERTGFPGEGGLERREVANETDIDLAVRTLLDEALDRATAILTEQGSALAEEARLLMERKTHPTNDPPSHAASRTEWARTQSVCEVA